MSSREVLTFQLGNYSNYIGAHWWNIQESYFQYDERNPSEISHDVLFREGKTLKGSVTFTPRVILMDQSENMVNVPILTETPNKPRSLTGNLSGLIPFPEQQQQQQQQQPEKHDYIKDLERLEKGQRVDVNQKDYKFSETVRSWSDYLRTRYHPRSVAPCHSSYPVEIFHGGKDIYASAEEDIVERIRNYLEECENLQGFQLLVDAANAFGGVADSLLLHLQDEYPNKTILTVPALPGHFADTSPVDQIKRTINIMLAYQKLTENSSLLVPVGTSTSAWRSLGDPVDFPNIVYDHSNSYETSAILASFLDTVTLKYRLREEYNYMYDLVSGLNYYSKKVCAATISLPFPMAPDAYLLDTLENLDDSFPLWSQLTPGCIVSDDTIFYQRITVRGIPVTRLRNPTSTPGTSRAWACSSVEELIHLYLSFRLSTISDVTSASLPLKTEIPYPQIFSRRISSSGQVRSRPSSSHELVESCPVISGLHCCKAVGRMLDSLHRCVKSVNVKKFQEFFGAHMDVDEFNECLEKLLGMGYGNASDVELR